MKSIMAIRIGKRRRPRKDRKVVDSNNGTQYDPRKDGLLDQKASATVSWRSIRDAVAAQKPDVDRTKLDDAIDSFIKDDKDYSYDLGFSDCMRKIMEVADDIFSTPKGAETFKAMLRTALDGGRRRSLVKWCDKVKFEKMEAWNEGAIYGFGKSCEGFNAEYPFDDGEDRSFEGIVTKDNPYRMKLED